MHFELSPLTVWFPLWIVNTDSEFQVTIFRNKRYYKMSQFKNDDGDYTGQRQCQGYINTLGFL